MSARWIRRLLWGTSGLAWFFWLGIEDRTIYFVLVLALLVVISAVITLPICMWLRTAAGRVRLLVMALVGSMAGMSVPLLAVLLMFIKISLHSHVTPDFSWQQIQAVLSVVPVWAAAGALAASAWWLLEPTAG